MGYSYILSGVSEPEYRRLKDNQDAIVSHVKRSFNDQWKTRVDAMDAVFRYNPSREAVGIFIRGGDGEKLAVDEDDLSEVESVFAGSIYTALESKLDRIRISKEQWID